MGGRDGYELERFVRAQESVYEQACAELRAGRKRTHWMWFIFPQIKGLGSSEMAVRYAISSIEEARAYLEHPVLGPRLREATQIVLELKDRTAEEIFGYPDNLKFHSVDDAVRPGGGDLGGGPGLQPGAGQIFRGQGRRGDDRAPLTVVWGRGARRLCLAGDGADGLGSWRSASFFRWVFWRDAEGGRRRTLSPPRVRPRLR
ncbi:DUF1810 domain-containing protein [Edaphobacter aggregans]|uniref:DUF1810 domain-containing protein n=1 Tax=Edaphobacter aggregans TaxID=570835 RepID=UPI003CCBDA48